MAPPMFIMDEMFWVELFFSMIIIVSCMVIYFRTRELYSLSFYKGIKYFSNAFLFFAIAFFARFFLRFIAFFGGPSRADHFIFGFGFFIFLYAGLMAGFFLLYSSAWKEFKNPEQLNWMFHPLAAAVAAAVIIFLFREETLLFLGLLFLVAAIFAYSNNKHSSNKDKARSFHVVYALLFVSFVLEGIAHLFVMISIVASILLYAVSSSLFLIILQRVIKSTERHK